MPRYIFLIKADPGAEKPPQDAPTSMYEEMTKFNEEMTAAGVMLSGDGFLPTSRDSYRLTYSSELPPTVVAGPFDVAKEAHVCGFWTVRTKDVEEALSWAKRIPFKEGEVVVRRIADSDDLGDAFTDELRDREGKMQEELAKRK
jgi:hypothetical protein